MGKLTSREWEYAAAAGNLCFLAIRELSHVHSVDTLVEERALDKLYVSLQSKAKKLKSGKGRVPLKKGER